MLGLKYLLTGIFLFPFSLKCFCQVPHIAGSVNIDIEKGLIQANLTITNIPVLSDPVLVLNKGMNIQYLKINDVPVGYNTDFGLQTKNAYLIDGLAYSPIIDSITPKTILTIKYVGAFPVYTNQVSQNSYADDQNTIAFKNKILRASYTSKWYPFIYDRETNRLITKATADLTFICSPSVKSIYINGCHPIKGKQARIIIQEANNLPLYIGNYSFDKVVNTWFLNTEITAPQKRKIAATVDRISAFYENVLKTKCDHSIVLAQIFSVGRPGQYSNWALADYPILMVDIKRIADNLVSSSSEIENINDYRLIAHELAHQYWGLTIQASTTYWGLYSESFAEYFALKAIEEKYDFNLYVNYIKSNYLGEAALQRKYPVLDSLEGKFIPTNYWYSYYPMCLAGLETTIGKTEVYQVFQYLLKNNTSPKMNFKDLEDAILAVEIGKEKYTGWKEKFINTSNCLHIINTIYK